MNINLNDKDLTEFEIKEIEKLLSQRNKNIKDDLEQMWYLIDLVWDKYKCDNKKLNWSEIEKFYSHPVWVLNGLFIESHQISMTHRHSISDWIVQKGFNNLIDYGGGFGTLAKLISIKNKNIDIYIYEPFPSQYTINKLKKFENIHFIDKLNSNYDCLVSIDVLEHLSDPLKTFSDMINIVKINGYLIIANAFYPMIKCHLPKNFHFRYTFNIFSKLLGLKVIGKLNGSHATIFLKKKESIPNWNILRSLEKISKIIFPIIETIKPILLPIKKFIIR